MVTYESDSSVLRTIPGALPRPVSIKTYGRSLVDVARRNSAVVCLSADLTRQTETDLFREAHPDRFFNLGMAEQNLMGFAAGMAKIGDIPFVNTFGVFATRRAYDQVAMQIAHSGLPVRIVGFMPGVSSPGGVTHQAIDDVALMRALPNMTVVDVSDALELQLAIPVLAVHPGPVYLRLKRGELPVLSDIEPATFDLGKARVVRQGKDVTIIASGMMVAPALDAASALAAREISASVINVHTIKPLDVDAVVRASAATGVVVVAENHSIIGGLGSAVADALVDAGVRVRMVRIGLRDRWAFGSTTEFLFKWHGLTHEAIAEAATRCLEGGPGPVLAHGGT